LIAIDKNSRKYGLIAQKSFAAQDERMYTLPASET
jgi:hypothetical protein